MIDPLGAMGVSAAAPEIPEIEQYELDGIPLFFLPSAGATILSIGFAVGAADEPVLDRGLTHLVEHLTLTSISRDLDHTNGVTEPLRVTFRRRGSPDEVSAFLRDLCAAIRRPRLGAIGREANVLRSEAALRSGMGVAERLIFLRTGYEGIGRASLPEYFVRRLDEAVLQRWITERFVAGNAAIWIVGQLPDDLFVDLEPGPRTARPTVTEIPRLETPTIVFEDAPGVGLSFLVPRSLELTVGLRAIDRHLHRILRVDQGLGYAIGTDYLPVNADQAFVTIWASCLPADARDVERILLETVDDMANRGPSEEELAEQHRQAISDFNDPASFPARLDRRVADLLLGSEPEPDWQLMDRRWRLQPEQVAAAVRAARETMLLAIPRGGTRPQRPLREYPGALATEMGSGQTFESVAYLGNGPFNRRRDRLFVGQAGVALDAAGGARLVTIPWDDAIVVVRGVGGRVVVARDGTTLGIQENRWRDGQIAARLVDRFGPSDRVVPAE